MAKRKRPNKRRAKSRKRYTTLDDRKWGTDALDRRVSGSFEGGKGR